MKKFTIFLATMFAALVTTTSHAQTADEVIAKHIEAMGGKEKLESLTSLKMTGSMNVQGMDIGITNTVVHNVGSRTDISVPGMGEGFQIMAKQKGWNYMPFQGQASPEEVDSATVRNSQYMLDVHGLLLDYANKGVKVTLAGKEPVDGNEAYKLLVTTSTGREVVYYIDTKTYYRVKSITKGSGGEPTVEVGYGDFRKTPEGYVFPFAFTNQMGTILFSAAEVNKPVDESIFKAN